MLNGGNVIWYCTCTYCLYSVNITVWSTSGRRAVYCSCHEVTTPLNNVNVQGITVIHSTDTIFIPGLLQSI